MAEQLRVVGSKLRYSNLLVVIKQTAFEEYSQVSAKDTTEQKTPSDTSSS